VFKEFISGVILFLKKLVVMTKTELVVEAAKNEVVQKNFGFTRQLLQVHEVVYEVDMPKVLRVDLDREDGNAIVYFGIKNEKFYLAVKVDTNQIVAVTYVGTESFNSVSFIATSETLTYDELCASTKLIPTSGHNNGSIKRGSLPYKYSSIRFEPNPEPDEFEDKLKKLLDFLEQDEKGVLELIENAGGIIQVTSIFHNGNTMLGGHNIDKETIKRMAALNLSIDFDLYAEGNFFLDDNQITG